jgi:hypothetical protein
MYRNKFVLGAAAAALAVTPIAAQAAPERAASPVAAEQEELRGKIWLPVLAAVIAGVIIYLLVDGGDDLPTSP